MAATTINGASQIRNTSIPASKLNLTLDEISAPVASLDLNSQLIVNLADPVSAQDATTKTYVDTAITAAVQGLTPKGSALAATTGALPAYTYDNGTSGVGATLTGNANGALPAQDGVTLTVGDILLVKNETSGNAPYNGLYTVTVVGSAGTPYVLTRATNFDSSANIVPNSYVFVTTGTVQHDTGWILNLDGAATVGTTDILFSQFSGAGTYTAGTAIDITSQVISVKYDNSTIGVNGSNQIYVPNAAIASAQLASSVAGAGLAGGAGTALSVNVDNSSIEITTDTLNVKALGITNGMLAGSIADSKLSTITTTDKVSGSAVQLGSNGGLADSTGLIVNVDGSTITKPSGVLGVPTSGITATQLASDAVTTAKILNANVTLAKIANASANSKLLGSGASGSGAAYVELTLGTGLSMSGTTLNASATGSFATGETPSGTINGSNVTFTLANAPTAGSVALYLNGVRQNAGGNDYSISGDTITFVAAPVSGDVLLADYRY